MSYPLTVAFSINRSVHECMNGKAEIIIDYYASAWLSPRTGIVAPFCFLPRLLRKSLLATICQYRTHHHLLATRHRLLNLEWELENLFRARARRGTYATPSCFRFDFLHQESLNKSLKTLMMRSRLFFTIPLSCCCQH
jgi:hypothetical protein